LRGGTKLTLDSDIQPSNIMIQIPDEKYVIEYLSESQTTVQTMSESDEDYSVTPTQSLREFYFPEGFNVMKLDIALSDWGVASFTDKHLTELIQPLLLRAPEVILEAPWSTPVDIWNLGALVPELLFHQNMFSGQDSTGAFLSTVHLEEMATLLGAFPVDLLKQAGLKSTRDIFTAEGQIQTPTLTVAISLEQRFSTLPSDEAPKFVELIKAMLAIDPAKRKTAEQLLEEAWLKHEYTGDLAF